jgi:hypothetical protein
MRRARSTARPSKVWPIEAVLFKLKPSSGWWQYSVLRGFDSGFGSPTALTVGPRGNLYGVEYTTLQIGGIVGLIIELTPGDPEWNPHLFTSFMTPSMGVSSDPLVGDAAGNVYGTAATSGGSFGDGVGTKLHPERNARRSRLFLLNEHYFLFPDDGVFQEFFVVVVGIVNAVMSSTAFFPRQRRA